MCFCCCLVEMICGLVGSVSDEVTGQQFTQRHRPAEVESLDEVDAPLPGTPELLQVFDPFCDHHAVCLTAHIDDASDDNLGSVVSHVGEEGLVQLHPFHPVIPECRKRGFSYTEVIHPDMES